MAAPRAIYTLVISFISLKLDFGPFSASLQCLRKFKTAYVLASSRVSNITNVNLRTHVSNPEVKFLNRGLVTEGPTAALFKEGIVGL